MSQNSFMYRLIAFARKKVCGCVQEQTNAWDPNSTCNLPGNDSGKGDSLDEKVIDWA